MNKSSLLSLFANEVGAICIPNFLSQQHCSLLIQSIEDEGFDFYENVSPPIGKIGITQFEHSKKDKLLYFQQVEKAFAKQKKVFKSAEIDVVEKVRQLFQETISSEVKIANEPEFGRYFSGLIRQINEAETHFDFAPYDAEGWSIANVVTQLSWNVYLRPAKKGGELVVYRKNWVPHAYEKFQKNPNSSYWFTNEFLNNTPFATVSPEVGTLVLSNSRNFHRVNLGEPIGSRVSISSFIGGFANGNFVFWS